MDKNIIEEYLDTASAKNIRDFAKHLVSILTQTQLKGLSKLFSARLTFHGKSTPTEEKSEPESEQELNDDEPELNLNF